MLESKTALGIDISDRRITLALVRKNKEGVKLLKAASGPVPDGAIKDGNIEDPATLAKALKELKARNRMHAAKAAVSLSVRPVIASILDAPKGTPRNIGQFVRNELKSYVALSGKEIAFDFCAIDSGQGQGGRLLAVAADKEKVAELVRACHRGGLNVEVVEPRLIAHIRALYAEKIEGRFGCDVLIAIWNGSDLTLCVFRKGILDFIRVESISEEESEPSKLRQWLARQINAVIRFYEIEVADSPAEWEVTVVTHRARLSDAVEKYLGSKIRAASIEVRTAECQDVLVRQNGCKERTSALAVGLAMGLLNIHAAGLRINLILPESAEVKSFKKQLVKTAFVIASLPLLMIFAGSGLSLMADKVNKSTIQRKQTQLSEDTYTLLQEQEALDEQIKSLSNIPGQLDKILGYRETVDWPDILEDVRNRTPETVRITELYDTGSARMCLKGLASSYEAVNLFVEMLNRSDYISSASLTEAIKRDKAGGLVTYTIGCSLTKGKSNG